MIGHTSAAVATTSAGNVGWAGMLTSLVLVAVAVGISIARRLGLARTIVWASIRAMAQLLLVGLVLNFLLATGRSLWWSWAWIVLMVLVAASTVARRAREVPGVFALALSSFAAAAVVSLGVLFGLGVFPLEARTLVPMAGIMIGNSMAATVLVGRRTFEELRDKQSEVEARLALGLSSEDAARPYVRAAMRTALIPQIETTKAVGIIALPGAMTGLILAGVQPFTAVFVQIAVMYLVLGSVATSTVIVGLGVSRELFTRDHRLVVPPRPAD